MCPLLRRGGGSQEASNNFASTSLVGFQLSEGDSVIRYDSKPASLSDPCPSAATKEISSS